MLRRYDLLADHFVDLTGTLSEEEKIALLKSRMQAIPKPTGEHVMQAAPSATDPLLGEPPAA